VLAAGGLATPSTPTMITGIVSSAGATLAGSGFTSTRTGTGTYQVTFTTAFPSSQAVVCTTDPLATGSPRVIGLTVLNMGGFTAEVYAGGSLADCQFTFLADTVV